MRTIDQLIEAAMNEDVWGSFSAPTVKVTKTKNSPLFNGTYKVATLKMSYADIVRKLGKPIAWTYKPGEEQKTQVEWMVILTITDNQGKTEKAPVSVYDFDQEGKPLQSITTWSVGGNPNTQKHIWKVKDVLGASDANFIPNKY